METIKTPVQRTAEAVTLRTLTAVKGEAYAKANLGIGVEVWLAAFSSENDLEDARNAAREALLKWLGVEAAPNPAKTVTPARVKASAAVTKSTKK